MPQFTAATFALCDGPHSVCGVCCSLFLNKSTSYLTLSLCLSLNSFCDEISRTRASLGPQVLWVLAGFESQLPGLKSQAGFWLGLSPSHVGSSPKQGYDWVRVSICGKWFQGPSPSLPRPLLSNCCNPLPLGRPWIQPGLL